MAYRDNFQRSASVYGSSSALRGVQLKIGDKFKPPTKVTLPIGWKTRDPARTLSLTYDFSLEQQVIEKAAAEKLAQEQEKNAQKMKELSNLPSTTPAFANMGGDILTPMTVISAGTNTQKENKETINYKDFEGDGDTPFELVELQSINNMDALKSVLQPDFKSDIPASTAVTSTDGRQDDELTYTNTNKSNGQSSTSDPQVMAPLTNPFIALESTGASGLPNQVTFTSLPNPSTSSNVPRLFPQDGYSSNTPKTECILDSQLDTAQGFDPFGPLNSSLSTSLVPNEIPDQSSFSSMSIPGPKQENCHSSSVSSTTLPTDRTVSLPGAKKVLPPPPSKPPPRRPVSLVNESSEMSSLVSSDGTVGPPEENRKRPVPKPRSKLPPLKSNPDASGVPPPLPPKKSKEKGQGYKNIKNPVMTVEKDLNRYPSLPPISPPGTPDSSVLSLHNLCLSMSPDEKQLVNQLSSMGFPAQRVARAVKNFGCKEREVLEFLISVNAMCDLGYSEDQVEMVLKENNSNQEKAEKFLNLMAQFKELGFQEEKIFEALKKSECDSNKTLDILTCAS